jgi:hypothetical protein
MVVLGLHTQRDMVWNMKEYVPMNHTLPVMNKDEN